MAIPLPARHSDTAVVLAAVLSMVAAAVLVAAAPEPYREAELSYYVQVEQGHPSMGIMLQPVNSSFSKALGLTIAFALNMTQAQASTSKPVGVAHGYTVDTSYDSSYAGFETEIIRYDDGVYKGTVHFQALLDGSDPAEVAVLGGTGSFRGVVGWGTISQVLRQPPRLVYRHTLYFH
ncbi:hypothetical protein L7F22_050840 [Adiantum nelumboides]|nr:hypothetical protein [Adiantum nelumboides]